MTSASLYIIACSAKNRIHRRLARLREPRYLVGAIAGAAYFLWLGARGRGRRTGRRRAPPEAAATLAALAAAGPSLAGMALLLLALFAWILPFESGLLEFSGAEIDLLFPAPVSRRQLLVHRLLRSQLGMLFGAAVIAFASPAGGWTRFQISIATWLIFMAIRTYYTGVTLVRSGISAGGKLGIVSTPLALVVAAAVTIAIAVGRALASAPVDTLRSAVERTVDATASGAARVALWPFAALAKPLFAASAASFAASAVVTVVAILWMLHTDDAVQHIAPVVAARKERERAGAAIIRARATGLPLAPFGPAEFAFLWKNGVQTVRMTGVTAIRIAAVLFTIVVAVTSAVLNSMHLRGGAAAACAVSMATAGFAAVFGPQVVRTDLRSDLLHLDMLKTWPVRAGAVVRGEMAWPAAMLTMVGWLAIGSAALFSPAAFPAVAIRTRAAFAAAAAFLMPALVAAQYLVQNAAALAFPAWVPLGHQRPRGVDAMGHRLIMLAAVLLVVTLLMVPGAIAGGAIWLALKRWAGAVAIVPATAVSSAIVIVEILVATELLAPLYERIDASAVERSE